MVPDFYPIGFLAEKTDTRVETIRFYEKIGLIPTPQRTQGNYRAYQRVHLDRLSFIRRARDLGFSLDQVRELLSLADAPERSCAAVDAIAGAHRAEVERKIRDLQAMKVELDHILDQCGHGRVADCRIIESLSPEA